MFSSCEGPRLSGGAGAHPADDAARRQYSKWRVEQAGFQQ